MPYMAVTLLVMHQPRQSPPPASTSRPLLTHGSLIQPPTKHTPTKHTNGSDHNLPGHHAPELPREANRYNYQTHIGTGQVVASCLATHSLSTHEAKYEAPCRWSGQKTPAAERCHCWLPAQDNPTHHSRSPSFTTHQYGLVGSVLCQTCAPVPLGVAEE